MENFLTPWFKPAIDQGKLTVGIKPATVLQMIAVEDIGKYGAWAFDNHQKLNGRAIDIAGDAKTMPQTAEIIGKAAGRKIEFVPTPIEEVRKFSEDFAIMLEWFDAVGYNADIKAVAKDPASSRPPCPSGPPRLIGRDDTDADSPRSCVSSPRQASGRHRQAPACRCEGKWHVSIRGIIARRCTPTRGILNAG